jgi:hypothetical protein
MPARPMPTSNSQRPALTSCQADVQPTFNPTDAPEDQIYADAQRPAGLPRIKPHSEHRPDSDLVDIWRIEERERVRSGLGLVASRILLKNTIGDIADGSATRHMASNYDSRAEGGQEATPFVSFTTDPEDFTRNLVLRHGFGLKDGRDSVVVHARVDPSRVLTRGENKEDEVLLVGGVSPDEHVGTYEVPDFVNRALPPEATVRLHSGATVSRDQAVEHWRQPVAS